MSKKAESYLRLIVKNEDASVVLSKGYAKQADELRVLGYAMFIPISSGGCYVALTTKGVEAAEQLKTIK